jgi:exopolysaccharide production protein ExoZ
MSSHKLDSLQCFRGLAALSVAFFHASATTNPHAFNGLFGFGFLGVDFFFVLSGFIILSSHFEDEKTISSLKTYYIKRFVRIFPSYWPISIGMIFIYSMLPNLSQQASAHQNISLISSLLLLPASTGPVLNVAWTLIYEVMFYFIFSIFFISGRIFFVFIVSWVSVILAVIWINGLPDINLAESAYDAPSTWFTHLISPINLEFVLGLITAYLVRIVPYRFGKMLFWLGLIGFIMLLCWPFALICRPLFGLPFAVLVLGGALLEKQGKLKSPQWLVRLGDASYSIYLVHNPLISVTNRLVGHFFGLTSWRLAIWVGVIVSVVLGILYHWIVEKPLIELFRKQFGVSKKIYPLIPDGKI